MMGKMLVKLFWWLLGRGWLPDFLLREILFTASFIFYYI
jgi:hypothetical protein